MIIITIFIITTDHRIVEIIQYCYLVSERMVQTLSVANIQPGTATGTGELAEQPPPPPPPSAGTWPGAGYRGETAIGACGTQPTGAREPAYTRRPRTDQTPCLAETSV